MERHLTRHSANREVAGDDEVVGPEHLDLISGEGDGRVVFHVEKIGGFEMAVAVFVATPQLARIHLHGNRRTRGIVRVVLQSFVYVLDAAAYERDQHVPGDELGSGVAGLKGPFRYGIRSFGRGWVHRIYCQRPPETRQPFP